MRKLPELYKNTNISLNNNKNYCYVEERVQENENDEMKIRDIIHENNDKYVLIKTRSNEYKTVIAAKVNNNIITINNDKIPISEIISIEAL